MAISALALLLWLGPPAVREGGAPLRDACSADAAVVARLDGGAPLRILFAMSGDIGTCYKVSSGGSTGYLPAYGITGLEDFEATRRSATDRDLPQMIRAELTRLRAEIGAQPSVRGVLELMDTNQPRRALEMIESALLPAARRDPSLLALAGLAAYRSDRAQLAADYWRESLAARPDPAVNRLLEQARRELAADKSGLRTGGGRFSLRYDGAELSQSEATAVLDAAAVEYARIDAALRCGISEPMTIIVQGESAYRASTGAADWSGGQFDGRVRVVLDGKRFTSATRITLAHEIVHACLARNGRFPAWFHEGMAQRWSGEQPPRDDIPRARHLPQPPPLDKTVDSARLFYAWSWLAVDTLYRRHGDEGVRALLGAPASITVPPAN
ncbi:MAG: hypothetical protein HZB13_16055 [Acidobacteria bacterium]|nr:hypothetical protein [Acidobacteriota bacterium]